MKAKLIRTKENCILVVEENLLEDFKNCLDTEYGWVVADLYGDDLYKLSKEICDELFTVEDVVDVEVEMYCLASASYVIMDFSAEPIALTDEIGLSCIEEKPKLDDNGCLILKRV